MSLALGLGIALANRRGSAASLDLDFLTQRYSMSLLSKAFSDIITFTRASSATRINPLGLIETVAANVPCIDHDPINLVTGTNSQTVALAKDRAYAVTAVGGTVAVAGSGVNVSQMGAASGVIKTPAGTGTVDVTFTPGGGVTALHVREVLGLSVWEQRTNLCSNSAGVGAAGSTFPQNWFHPQAYGGNVFAGEFAQVEDMQGYSGFKYRINGTPSMANRLLVDYGIAPLSVQSGNVYSARMYFETIAGSHDPGAALQILWFDDANAYISLAETLPVAVTTDRLEFVISGIAPQNATKARIRIDHSNAVTIGQIVDFTCRVTGVDMQAGSSIDFHIPTFGAQVTRASDVVNINELSPWFNQQGGTLVAEFSLATFGGSYFSPWSLDLGYEGRLGVIGTPNDCFSMKIVSPSAPDIYSVAQQAHTGINKVVCAWDASSFSQATNGNAAKAYLHAGITQFNRLKIGSYDLPLNGHIRKIRYYPKRLSDAQLQSLTA